MALSRATANLIDKDSDALFSVQGTSDTIAEARAELQAKLAMITNATVLSVTESSSVDVAGYPVHADGGDSKGTFTLRKGTDRATTRTVNIPNVTTDIKNATAQDGSIDIENALVTAFGDAYRDADGAGGYAVIRGYLHP